MLRSSSPISRFFPASPCQRIGDGCINGEFAFGFQLVAILNAGEQVGLAGKGVALQEDVDERDTGTLHGSAKRGEFGFVSPEYFLLMGQVTLAEAVDDGVEVVEDEVIAETVADCDEENRHTMKRSLPLWSFAAGLAQARLDAYGDFVLPLQPLPS